MSQITAPHPLVQRLTNLRKRVRLLLTLHAGGLLVAAFLGALVVLVLADYLVHLGGATRLVIGLAVVVGCVAFLYRRLVVPLSTKLTDQFLASRVENVNSGLADELMSAVHFIQHGTPQGNALAAKAVEAAKARAQGVRFEDALDFKPAARAWSAGGALIALVVVVGLANASFASTALARWFKPMAGAEWAKVMQVDFLWDKTPAGKQPQVLPQGEAVEIRARLRGPSAMHRRVFLYRATDMTRESYALMQCQNGESSESDAVYATQIAPEDAHSLRLRIEAVDDETPSVNVRLARRPAVSGLAAKITPPAYVAETGETSVDLLQQRATVIERSRVRFVVRATNPLGINDRGEPDVQFLDQSKENALPISFSGRFVSDDHATAEIAMSAETTLAARVQVRDENGFVNLSGGSMNMDVVKDALPTVSIEDPKGALRLVPEAAPHVRTQATDDLGIDGGKWRLEAFDQKPGDPPRNETDFAWDSRSKDQGGNTVAVHDFEWNLAPLGLKVGDRLSVFAMAQDNYLIDGKRHDWVKSPALSITIISKEDAIKEAQSELIETKNKVDALKAQQEKTEAQTKALQQTIAKSGTATGEQSRQLADLTAQQAQQASTAKGLSQRFEQIAAKLAMNKLSDEDIAKAAEAAKGVMNDVSQNNMNKAASELGKASEAAGRNADAKAGAKQKSEAAGEASKSAGSANAEQNAAIAKMDQLTKDLSNFDSIAEARRGVEAALKAEREIERKIEKSDTPFGAKREQLTPEQRKKLDDLAEQAELQKKTAELIEQIKSMAGKSGDQAAKQTLDAAAKAGQETQVTQNQGDASDSAKGNNMSGASSSAGKASAGLQKMKDELDDISRRQLEALSQQLGDLIAQLRQHLKEETSIKDGTEHLGAAAGKGELKPFADRQGRLHLATIATQKQAESIREAREAAVTILEAVDKMQASAVELYSGRQAASLPPENEAMSALQRAITQLEKAKKPVDDALKDKDLAYYIKQYQEMKAQQEAIKAGSDKIKKDDKGELARHDSIALGDLAASQGKLATRLQELSKDDKLAAYDAVIFVNGQILEFMTESKVRLSKAAIGKELAWNQQKAIDRLDEIIKALEEEKAKKNDFDNPGGEGGGGGGKPPLIPAAQELKLLKMMQVGVNKDTVEKNGELAAAQSDADKNAVGEQVQKLGATQNKIHDIAQKIIDKLKQ